MLSASSLSMYLSTRLQSFITIHNVKIPEWHQMKCQTGTWLPGYIPICVVRQ